MMSRRKQQKPRHLETSQELATSLQNGIASGSDSEDDEHVCGKCRAEFPTLTDFIKHKVHCVSKRPVIVFPVGSKNGDLDAGFSNDEDEDSPPNLINPLLEDCDKRYQPTLADLPQLVQQLSDTNVTLEHLRNTTVAVAQHGRSLPESQLAALLSNIHLQQVAQLHVIQELQAQILGVPTSPKSIPLVGTAALTPPQSGSESAMGIAPPNGSQPSAPTPARTSTNSSGTQAEEGYEPNTLELLQRHTEQALQNTMAGGSFLLYNSGELCRMKRSKDGKIDESVMKHACKFCGKVFGSESGLQIHLRSHTGERPFKCSICSSSFSTKGNLKVHFQRHKERLEIPSDFQNGNNALVSTLNGDPNGSEKAIDFSSGKNSPCPTGQTNGQSESITSNDISDDSDDGSANGENDLAINEHQFDDDDEHDSDASALNDNNLDGDSDNMMGMRPLSFSSPTFTPFFRPTTFSGTLPESPLCLPQPTSANPGSNDNGVYHGDPSLYQELLPRIGSNDNSWESLMEVTETSETTKLQKLVDNIEVADPNQCIICHRVLSCRSALQMHYRIHTGERPFRCKICGRAFTTKGNLKTHMSVHRHKSPSRILHQCPVCHKQFANSVILQQHVRMHTAVRGVVLPDSMIFSDGKNSTLLPPSYPRPLMMPNLVSNMEPLALTSSGSKENLNGNSVIKDSKAESQRSCLSSPAGSSSSSESPTPNPEDAPGSEEGKSLCMDLVLKTPQTSTQNSTLSESSSPINMVSSLQTSTPLTNEKPNPSVYDRLPSPILKLDPKFLLASVNGTTALTVTSSSILSKIKENREKSSLPLLLGYPNDKPLPMTLPNECPIPLSLQSERHLMSMSLPHTTSEFTASLAALENHVKAINSSTTNPLPFPPPLGMGFMPNYFRQDFTHSFQNKDKSRAYSPSNSKNNSDISADESSTPGSTAKSDSPKSVPPKTENGALDLTPRATNRPATDLKRFTPLAGLPFPPPHARQHGTTCQICFKTFACHSALEIHYRSHTKERPFKCDVCDRGFSTRGNMKQHMLTHKIRDLPPELFTSNSQVTTINTPVTSPMIVTQSPDSSKKLEEFVKRPLGDGNRNPSPKRSSGVPKHVCEVCHKPFSSGSALQIHMRTHTGVKPFQCNICSRAFTTKGNLKVHMGTHMSTSGTSRRGRRMSLDISPLSLPLGKPGDYPPRHDLFFPYLPPFLNGMTQNPAKMNEISVIQSAGNRDSVMASLAGVPMSMAPPSFAASVRPLALVTTPSQKPESQRQENESPIRNRDQCSPARPIISADPPTLPDKGASWPWKIACIRCNKICSSSTELEIHINKEHSKAGPSPFERHDIPIENKS